LQCDGLTGRRMKAEFGQRSAKERKSISIPYGGRSEARFLVKYCRPRSVQRGANGLNSATITLPEAGSTPTFQRIAKLRQRAAKSKPSRGPAHERSDRGLLSRIPPSNSRRGSPSDRARQTRQAPPQEPAIRPPYYYVVCEHPDGQYLVDDPNCIANAGREFNARNEFIKPSALFAQFLQQSLQAKGQNRCTRLL
jgi:hypothetical protein